MVLRGAIMKDGGYRLKKFLLMDWYILQIFS
jgi:hypothetical protein